MARTLDDTDRRLIALLRANARESTSELARRLGLPRSTVHERIERLRREGVISGFSVLIGREPFADYSQAVVFISAEARRLYDVVDGLRNLPEITACFTVNGEYDIC